MQWGLGKSIATGTKASAFFSRFATGASAKTVWRSMRAEQVSVEKRWRRPRNELIRRARRDTGKITEKCSRTQRLHGNRAKPGRDDAMRGIQGARAGS